MNQGEKRKAHARSTTSLGATAWAIEPVPDTVQVDQIDMDILRLLAADSRQSQRAIARQVGMSAPAVGERLARLEKSGVIKGYSITVDWGRLGYSMEVFLHVLAVTGADFGELITDLNSIPEVFSVHSVTGQYDFLARLRVRDHQHLTRLIINRIWQIPSIQRTETLISLASPPNWTATVELLNLTKHQQSTTSGRRIPR